MQGSTVMQDRVNLSTDLSLEYDGAGCQPAVARARLIGSQELEMRINITWIFVEIRDVSRAGQITGSNVI